MAEFANPFDGNIENLKDDGNIIQALRIDMASELEASFLYEAHANKLDVDSPIRKILLAISEEERKHAYMLNSCIVKLTGDAVLQRDAVSLVNQFNEGLTPDI